MILRLQQAIFSHWNLTSSAILLLSAIWILVSAVEADPSTMTHTTIPKAGFLAPDFELESLAGDTVKLSDFQGKPVIINFWASWCQPCRIEMPAIQKAFEKLNELN
jgi:thiol-disulfide isomerase/thioredoxin